MKTSIFLLTLAALPCFVFATDVTGTWKAEFDSQIGTQDYTYTFKQDGTNLTGKAQGVIGDQTHESDLKEGVVNSNTISFVETMTYQDNDIRITYTGTLTTNADEIKFTRQVGDIATEEIVAKRQPAAPAVPATPPPADSKM
jgi:hypothetical protein